MAKPNPTRPARLGRGLSSLMAQPVRVPPAALVEAAQGAPHPAAPAPPAAWTRQTGESSPSAAEGLSLLPVADIQPNPHQPRQHFDDASLQALAASIRREGVMQPVVVRPCRDAAVGYELVAGERRWRAARLAGLDRIPALVRELDDQRVAEWALIENLQREDLNPLERAQAFRSLHQTFGLSHGDIAERVGLDRSTVTNLLRILELDPRVQTLVRDNLLSMGQARALAAVADADAQHALAQRVVAEGLSVRQVEQAVRQLADGVSAQPAARTRKGGAAAHVSDLERQVSQQIGSRVRIRPGRRKGTGAITIEFYSLDQFDALMTRLGVSME